MHFNAHDLTGRRIGRLVVQSLAGRLPVRWLCRCDCGTMKVIPAMTLTRPIPTQSCGCYRLQRISESHKTHGLSTTPKYYLWASVKRRCYNPNVARYADYGGRGIKMHASWVNDPVQFMRDIGERPSPKHQIDRIDTNGDYEPGNVRWATPHEQAGNKRNNRWIEFDGKRMILADWARVYGIDVRALHHRLAKGWDMLRALVPQKRRHE